MNKKAFSLIELSIVILIVGIIITGITQSSRLVRAFRLSNARTITQSSPIYSFKDLYMWLDATAIDPIDVEKPEDGQVVTTWKDQNPFSIIKHNPTQSTASYKPTFKTEILNSLPAIRFDGSNDGLEVSVNTFEMTKNGEEFTLFMVGKVNTNSATAAVPFFLQNGAGTNRVSCELSSGVLRFDFPNGSSGSGVLSGSASSYNRNRIFTLEKTATTQTIYLDGASDATRSNSNTLANFTEDLAIGIYNFGSDWLLGAQIDIGEIIIYPKALKTEERQAIEQYLGKKWGIDVS